MKKENKISRIKVFVAITYVAMIVVNALANILPINGKTTGEVSDKYKNLFAPAGLTFAIWGVIYFLLACHVLYQFGFFKKEKSGVKNYLMDKIGIYFSVSSIANILWIITWHYDLIVMSVIFMLVILYCLILINQNLAKEKLSPSDILFVRIPFSVYFSWITVATIANATVMLVSIGWRGFGISESIWTVIVLLVGITIGILTILKNRDVPYGLVFIWAYLGIIIKHLSSKGFAGQYPAVIITVLLSIIAILISIIKVNKENKKRVTY